MIDCFARRLFITLRLPFLTFFFPLRRSRISDSHLVTIKISKLEFCALLGSLCDCGGPLIYKESLFFCASLFLPAFLS